MTGILFDIYRLLRRQMGWNSYWTFGGDLLFSAMAFFIIAYWAEEANHLALRWYLWGGAGLGLLLYFQWAGNCSRFIMRQVGLLFYRTGKGIYFLLAGLMFWPYRGLQEFGLLFYRIFKNTGVFFSKKCKKKVE